MGNDGWKGKMLSNDRLRVLVLPGQGARIASLLDIQSSLEWLLQPSASFQWPQPLDPWARFEDSACAGIDDCLPSVAACDADTPGGPVPDHGDFWRLDWKVSHASQHEVRLAATGYSRPLAMEKHLILHPSGLEIRYCIRNLQDRPHSFLYALHPLFAVDAGDRVVLPPEVSSLRVGSSRLERLGPAGSRIRWPRPQIALDGPDLSHVRPVSSGLAEMLYTDKLRSNWCALYRSKTGQGITVRFEPDRLPYLGLWLCYGGWPADEALPRQYAVAFEPTVAPYGSLAEADGHGAAPVLGAGESFEFSVRLELTRPSPMTYEEFAAECLAQP